MLLARPQQATTASMKVSSYIIFVAFQLQVVPLAAHRSHTCPNILKKIRFSHDNGTRVMQWDEIDRSVVSKPVPAPGADSSDATLYWLAERRQDGYWRVRSMEEDAWYCLEAPTNDASGTLVVQNCDDANFSQAWGFTRMESVFYEMESIALNLCVTVRGSSFGFAGCDNAAGKSDQSASLLRHAPVLFEIEEINMERNDNNSWPEFMYDPYEVE